MRQDRRRAAKQRRLVAARLTPQAERRHYSFGRGLDPVDVAVREAAPRVSRVVAGNGLLNRGLRVLAGGRSGVAVQQHAVGGGQAMAGIERVRERQTKAREVGAVDLHEAEIDGMPLDRRQFDARGNGVLAGCRVVGPARGVVVQRERVKAAFRLCHRGQGLDMVVRRAGRRELREGG